MQINFIDLPIQQAGIRRNIEQRLLAVLDHGRYVGGPEVAQLEQELSKFCGAKHALTCANGTDALTLVLLAKDIQAGDAVFVPSFTFAASAEVVAATGATPVFVDVNKEDYNISLQSLEQALALAKSKNLNPKAIIAVDIFGLPANYSELNSFADKNSLWILADAAQSFGASLDNKKVGMYGVATTTSFFPAKPLGCYGDGGCIFTDDDNLAEIICSLKSHGQGDSGTARNHFVRVGLNSRLDSFQAAVLLEKLKIFPDELKHRQSVADAYSEMLSKDIIKPKVSSNKTSSWAQYTLILPEYCDRAKVIEHLKAKGIPTAVYYDIPVHKQPAYEQFAAVSPELPNTEYLAKHVMSLPMDGYLTMDKIAYIVENLNAILNTFK